MLNTVLVYVRHFNSFVDPYLQIITPSRFNNYSMFDKFILLNLVLLLIVIMIPLFKALSPLTLYKRLMKFVFSLGFIKRKIQKQVAVMKETISKDVKDGTRVSLKDIPYKGTQLLKSKSEKDAIQGKMSGSRYPTHSHSQIVSKLAKRLLFTCPQTASYSPLLTHLEKDVLEMTANMINFKTSRGEACGYFLSGGTESIFMAIYLSKEYKYRYENVTRPNLVVCKTGHIAAMKACQYLGIELREVDYDEQFCMSVSECQKHIDSNTVLVYTSYPNYPTGTVDPIKEIAAVCEKRNIPVHVDMCLGGFVAPFIEGKLGSPSHRFPKGVVSVSVDHHKYGLAAKGCSAILFSDEKYKNAVTFNKYMSPTIICSRAGFAVASAWISMMKLGVKGYTENALALQSATRKMNAALHDLKYKTFGQPDLLAFNFLNQRWPIARLQNLMKKKGWGLSISQQPMFLRYSLTPLNCLNIDSMIADLKECTVTAEESRDDKPSSELELYGACAKIPDTGTKDTLLKYLLDSFVDL